MTVYLQELMYLTSTSFEIKPIAVIDNAKSVIWVRQYDTPGEFELYIPASTDIFRLIKSNMGYLLVTREGRADVMYVEYVKLTESAEDGDHILLKGRTIDCVMERRVIGYPTKFTITPIGAAIKNLIEDNMIYPEDHGDYTDSTTRIMSPFRFVMPTVYGPALNRAYNGENLLETVGALLKESNCGLRCTLEDGEIIMRLYRGQNRPAVRFSRGNENLLLSEYECDIRGQCNTAFVYAEGDSEHEQADGSNPYTVTAQYPSSGQESNYARYEGFTTASDTTTVTSSENVTNWAQGKLISGVPSAADYAVYCPDYFTSGRKISVSWVLTYGQSDSWCSLHFYDTQGEFISAIIINRSGETVTPPENAATFRIGLYKSSNYHLYVEDVSSASYTALRDRPQAEYTAAIAGQGFTLINTVSNSLSGETIETGLYTIGVDYDLGDTVTVENSYGIRGTAKVGAITEVEDAEGYRIYPTFTDWAVT